MLSLETAGITSAHNSLAIPGRPQGGLGSAILPCTHGNRVGYNCIIWQKAPMSITPSYSYFKSQWDNLFLEWAHVVLFDLLPQYFWEDST